MSASEGNKVDETTYQTSEPALCANGCGFFGTAANMGLCSRCYSQKLLSSSKISIEKVEKIIVPEVKDVVIVGPSTVVEVAAEEEKTVVRNRCMSCNKKVGLTGFKCRCGNLLCGTHRYPEKHDCTFDFKIQGKEAIAKANPVIKADKIQRI